MSDSYPSNRHDMLRASYTLVYSRPCPRCQAPTDRWRTRNGKEITMNAGAEHERVQPHAATCAARRQERDQRVDQARPVAQFARANQAKAVVLVDRFGRFHFSVDVLGDPVDLHNTLTQAADAVRNHLADHISKEQA